MRRSSSPTAITRPGAPRSTSPQPVVRDFFIHNALYWLEEFRFDGLRLDAVHAILDDSRAHILTELARARAPACGPDRHVHLVLENDANQARICSRAAVAAALRRAVERRLPPRRHVVLTGESDGYYVDYQRDPLAALGRALARGLRLPGRSLAFTATARRAASRRGDLPPSAFVGFLQNHDQIGNRAFGERLAQLASAPDCCGPLPRSCCCRRRFRCCSWARNGLPCGPSSSSAISRASWLRRCAMAGGASSPSSPPSPPPTCATAIPDPNDAATFQRSKLDWSEAERDGHADHLHYCRELLAVRRRELMPRLGGADVKNARYDTTDGPLRVSWRLADNAALTLLANLRANSSVPVVAPRGRMLHSTHPHVADDAAKPGWFVAWYLADRGA